MDIENELGQPAGEGLETQTPEASVPQPQPEGVPGTEGAAPSAPSFNPNEWALNYKGQQVTPKDRQHLINLAQQGYGYSQAMEILNKEKREIQEMRSQYGKYAELDERFKKDPNFQQHILQAVQSYGVGGSREGEQMPPQLAKVMQELEEIKNFQKQYERKAADAEVQREMEDLRKTYPDEQWDFNDGSGTLSEKLLKHAYDNHIPNLKSAYRDFMFDKMAANTKAEALKKAEAEKAAALKAGKVAGAGMGAAPSKSVEYAPGDSYNDITQKALSMLRT